MNRSTEVEILAATLEEPNRTALRDAIQAQKQGWLTLAARLTSDHLTRPTLRWPTLLLALEDAELRLGGAVLILTPATRFSSSDQFPLFEERWGVFGCTIWPNEHKVRLFLAPGDHVLNLRAAGPIQHREVREALAILAQSIEDYFGVRTFLIVVDDALLEKAEHEE